MQLVKLSLQIYSRDYSFSPLGRQQAIPCAIINVALLTRHDVCSECLQQITPKSYTTL